MNKRCQECKELLPLNKFGFKKKKATNPITQRLDTCRLCTGKRKQRLKVETKTNYRKVTSTKKCLRKFSKDLRKNQTVAEKKLQKRLEEEKIVFISQYIVFDKHHKYIVDFFLPINQGAKGIVIEVDGGYHQSDEMIEKDRNRDDYLHLKGMYVIRITNDQTKTKLDDLINIIKNYDIKYTIKIRYSQVTSNTIILS